ncbi:hypothetical protein ADL21_00840 [Streptomyces albus subsp. albus]|nr:hypothetical protein ADL21_00840 [Streptomyces albus subsp. albus]
MSERKNERATVVQARDLAKRYGDRTVVDSVSFTIQQGEVFTLLGPNGAGKTTLVEILEGLRRPSSGSAVVLGADPARRGRRWRSRIGVVLQGSRDHAEWTVIQVVREFGSYYPRRYGARELLGLVGLSDQADRKVGKLSGGQRRRLDVALGLVGRPELLFLDEPTTGFDPQARREFWTLIGRLKDEGLTVVLTTHYLQEAEALADRVAVLRSGRIIDMGEPHEIGADQRLPSLVRWRENGRQCSESVHDPAATVAELQQRLGGEVPDLAVVRPSLEDRYVNLIGEGE